MSYDSPIVGYVMLLFACLLLFYMLIEIVKWIRIFIKWLFSKPKEYLAETPTEIYISNRSNENELDLEFRLENSQNKL